MRNAFRFVVISALSALSLFTTSFTHLQAPPPQTTAPSLPNDFELTSVVSGLDRPTALIWLPDGRMLIALKNGVIRLVDAGYLEPVPVADLRLAVNENGDRGLLGMAADSKFAQNSYLYLHYTYDPTGAEKESADPRPAKIVRYALKGNALDVASAAVVLDAFSTDTPWHSAGALKFAKDGSLFTAYGDGAHNYDVTETATRAQSLDYLNGKIIRIDTQGNGLPGNPFFEASNPRSAKSRTWSLGQRYAWRFVLHPQTGIPYAGDVGWISNESIERATAGANFGWPCVEGGEDRPEYQSKPICKGVNKSNTTKAEFVYPHAGNNASVTGGDFNFGSNFPASMKGDYFFGDSSTNVLRRAQVDGEGRLKNVEIFAKDVGASVDIQFGPDGALYYLSYWKGELNRISYKASNQAPAAKLSAGTPAAPSPQTNAMQALTGYAPLTVTLSAAGSADPDQDKLSFAWRFGDEVASAPKPATALQTPMTVTHVYTQPGRYVARLTVTDAKGWRQTVAKLIYVAGGTPSTNPAQPLPEDGTLRTWWLMGGYPKLGLDDDALKGEATFTPQVGRARAWVLQSSAARINLAQYLSPKTNALGYAFVWIESPDARAAKLGFVGDDGIALWLNGEEIWRNYNPQPVSEAEDGPDRIPIKLRPGLNALLVKVSQKDGAWAFKVKLMDAGKDPRPLRDVWVRTHLP